MKNSLVVLHLLREFTRAPLTFLNAFSKFFLIIYVIMSENEWIENQKTAFIAKLYYSGPV